MSDRASAVAVALLYETRGRGEHLRETLNALGAPIVYEADTHAFDRDALVQSQANVVVVNLDNQDDPALDDVCALLDDSRYRVVFNDGDVSSGLTGWDHARWMRHLASKVLGAADIDPPRPLDAEPVPPAPRTLTPLAADAASVEGDSAPAAVAIADAAPEALRETEDASPQSPGQDAREPLPELEDPSPMPPRESAADTPVPAHVEVREGDDVDALVDVDLGEIAALLDYSTTLTQDLGEFASEPVAEVTQGDDDTAEAHLDLAGIEDLLAELDAGAAAKPEPPQAGSDSGFDLPDLDVPESDFSFEPSLAEAVDPEAGIEGQPEIAESEEAVPVAADTEPAAGPGVSANWSLEDILDDPADGVPPAVPAGPATFGIETMSPAEFLAPETDAEAAPPAFASLDASLELIPLEEAVAPKAVETLAHENWLDPDSAPKAKITRVWVLGASIGGPESVREFLGEFPRDYPALFLLAQHLGEEFVDMMTQQLARTTALTVRTPTHGERVGHGEVVVVPTSHRLLVDNRGVIVLERVTGEAAYRPSIDRVIADVADRFGKNAGAIVFSGMSDDAVAGCRHLAEKGGRVYAQRPDTCVVSTMIESVCEAGIVEFLGSPGELASKLLAEPA